MSSKLSIWLNFEEMMYLYRSVQWASILVFLSLPLTLSAQDSFWSMTNIAGTGDDTYTAESDALETGFQNPGVVDVDADGNIYFGVAAVAEGAVAGIYKLDHITNELEFLVPHITGISGLAVHKATGDIYFSRGAGTDPTYAQGFIYCRKATGDIVTIAGDGSVAPPPLGPELAISNPVAGAGGLKFNPDGTFLYYTASNAGDHNIIQKIEMSTGLTYRVAGIHGPAPAADVENGTSALAANLNLNLGLAWDTAGNLYFATGTYRIKKIISDGTIWHVAGTGEAGKSDEGVPASTAKLNMFNNGFVINDKNILFLTEVGNFDIRRIELHPGTTLPEIITTIGGSGYNEGDASNPSGDLDNGFHKPAIEANIKPADVFYLNGDLIITDYNRRLRRATICDNSVITSTTLSNSSPCQGDTIKLSFSGELNDAEVWRWYKDECEEGESLSNSNILFIEVTGNESYFVIGTGGCATNDECTEIKIEVDCQDYFNTFTPNGDGFNDYFAIPLVANFPVNSVSFYNRWGDMLETIENYDNAAQVWWGTNGNGDSVDSGTYFFTVVSNGELKLSGWVEIIK